jgi:hypothetical protein
MVSRQKGARKRLSLPIAVAKHDLKRRRTLLLLLKVAMGMQQCQTKGFPHNQRFHSGVSFQLEIPLGP